MSITLEPWMAKELPKVKRPRGHPKGLPTVKHDPNHVIAHVRAIASYLLQHPDATKAEVSEATGHVFQTIHIAFIRNRHLFEVSGLRPPSFGRPPQTYRLLPAGVEVANRYRGDLCA